MLSDSCRGGLISALLIDGGDVTDLLFVVLGALWLGLGRGVFWVVMRRH